MNDAPIILTGHWIKVAFAQEALILCLDQVVDLAGVTPVFGVEHTDRTGILLAAMDGFGFFVAPHFFSHFRRSQRQRQKNQQSHEQHTQQEKPILISCAGLSCCRLHWRNGRLCVL